MYVCDCGSTSSGCSDHGGAVIIIVVVAVAAAVVPLSEEL